MRKWDERFMTIAHEVSSWSSCMRRSVGAVIVKDKHIIATGYNGAVQGVYSCVEKNNCLRSEVATGEKLDYCMAVHAEQNAIAQASKLGISTVGATMYVTTMPCVTCMKLIINSGIKRVVYLQDYPSELTKMIAEQADIILEPYE